MKTPRILNTWVAAVVFGGAALMVMGCANNPNNVTDTNWVPGYSFTENGQRIARYDKIDAEEFMDDVDVDLLMRRPSDPMTWWNVYTSN